MCKGILNESISQYAFFGRLHIIQGISTMTPSGEDSTNCATCHTEGVFFSSMVSGMKLGASAKGSDFGEDNSSYIQ